MDGFGGFDILFIALVAVFLGLRLRSVLGTRTGAEKSERWRAVHTPEQAQPGATPAEPQAEAPADNVTPFPGRATTPGAVPPPLPAQGALEAGIAAIRAADPGFDAPGFAGGAKAAFEMIVQAYAQGDLQTLKPLLAPPVYDSFSNAVGERQRARQTLETTLIAVQQSELVEARLNGRIAECTIKFVSQQANVTRDAQGNVIDGDPAQVDTITDLWTFARDTRARDPNWQLIRTETAH
jgi:predicted lipid-binding transport protein (Tim44 family)